MLQACGPDTADVIGRVYCGQTSIERLDGGADRARISAASLADRTRLVRLDVGSTERA